MNQVFWLDLDSFSYPFWLFEEIRLINGYISFHSLSPWRQEFKADTW